MQVTGTIDEGGSFVVNMSYWDLSLKVPVNKVWSELVFAFAGPKSVQELGAVPYDLYPNAEGIEKELKQRGRKIRDIPRGGLKWFKGFVNVPVPGYGTTRRKWIEGRIIVDPEEYDKMNPQPYNFDIQPPVMPEVPLPGAVGSADTEDEVKEDHLAQSRSIVRGFSLATKSWHEFEVDDISDIEWNDQVNTSPKAFRT